MPEWAALIISGLVLLAVGAFITFLTKMKGEADHIHLSRRSRDGA